MRPIVLYVIGGALVLGSVATILFAPHAYLLGALAGAGIVLGLVFGVAGFIRQVIASRTEDLHAQLGGFLSGEASMDELMSSDGIGKILSMAGLEGLSDDLAEASADSKPQAPVSATERARRQLASEERPIQRGRLSE